MHFFCYTTVYNLCYVSYYCLYIINKWAIIYAC